MGIETGKEIRYKPVNKLLTTWYEDNPVDRVRKAQDGDPQSLSHVANLLLPYVVATVRRLMPESPDVDDLAQDAMIKAITHINQCPNTAPGSFPRWTRRIARTEVFNFKNRVDRIVPTDPAHLDNLAPPNPGFEESIVDDILATDRRQALSAALQNLLPLERTVIGALNDSAYNAGSAYKEIAKSEGIPHGSIGPTRARAVKKLQTAVGKHR